MNRFSHVRPDPTDDSPREIVLTGYAARFLARRADFSAGDFRVEGQSRHEHPGLSARVPFKYRGSFPEGAVRVVARWPVLHPRFGAQLDVLSVEPLTERLTWIACVLRELPGIGPRTTERLLERYGAELPNLLDAPNAIGRLNREVGIRAPIAASMVGRWQALGEWERAFEQAIREAGISAPLRARIEKWLRQQGRWGEWSELETGLADVEPAA